ncbi:MAG: hypothetical protein ACRC1H_14830, partial [Caldilineaceae bacterium]
MSRHRGDLFALLILLLLALAWFAPVLLPALSGRTLLPWDNLYTFEPWRALRPNLIPHNALLSDLVLQNAVWKLHIRDALSALEAPVWNPNVFTGIPFLAGGQASTLYPPNILFYLLPLEAAYGWFTALQVALAGWSMYALARVLRLRVIPALAAGVVYMFSGFLITSVVFTMFVAAVPWLPLLLAIIEWMIRKQEQKGNAPYSPVPWVAAGAGVVGMVVLAGHPELIYYTLITAGAWALVRLIVLWRVLGATTQPGGRGRTRRVLGLATWLLAMVGLGLALGAVQLAPLLELLPLNFREGSASLAQVREWAWPSRHVLTFALPDVFGNPSHHHWFDFGAWRWQQASVNANGEPVESIFWGIKNYVEGGNYLGVAAWLLAAIGVAGTGITLWSRRRAATPAAGWIAHEGARPVHVGFFAGLAVVSLLFAFGTPLYGLLFYGLPGWNQLHSPFRWVFPYTLAMAGLAGIGLDLLLKAAAHEAAEGRLLRRCAEVLAVVAILASLGALAAVLASIVVPAPFEAFGDRLLAGSDLARAAFADGRMFWNYQAQGLVRLGLAALASGTLVLALLRLRDKRKVAGVAGLMVALLALDLYSAHGRFNPASDTTLSPLRAEGTPAVVEFLNELEAGNQGTWRFTTFNLPGEKTFNANVGMYYGWQDLRGYDSIIPRQYVA